MGTSIPQVKYKGGLEMKTEKERQAYLDWLMRRFAPIGEDPSGGVTRLGYTREEDLMHEELEKIASEEGFLVQVDEVGNTFVSIDSYDNYHLIGSHLDSVVNGGRFDGVIGVAVGILLLKMIKEENLDIPVKVVAFRCEESSNFMKATIGSGLITGESFSENFLELTSMDGVSLVDEFARRGYSQNPKTIEGLLSYIEVHIEQARLLESEEKTLGIVEAIAGNRTLSINLEGLAEHAGATPMGLRADALAGAAEIILALESLGEDDSSESSVITVGSIKNLPNSVNVVPGQVDLHVDLRDIINESMDRLVGELEELLDTIARKRDLEIELKQVSEYSAVVMDEELRADLLSLAKEMDIDHMSMVSGAGHDAMKFTELCKTAMIFIPCKEGISHNPKEDAKVEDAVVAADLLFEYFKSKSLSS